MKKYKIYFSVGETKDYGVVTDISIVDCDNLFIDKNNNLIFYDKNGYVIECFANDIWRRFVLVKCNVEIDV